MWFSEKTGPTASVWIALKSANSHGRPPGGGVVTWIYAQAQEGNKEEENLEKEEEKNQNTFLMKVSDVT